MRAFSWRKWWRKWEKWTKIFSPLLIDSFSLIWRGEINSSILIQEIRKTVFWGLSLIFASTCRFKWSHRIRLQIKKILCFSFERLLDDRCVSKIDYVNSNDKIVNKKLIFDLVWLIDEKKLPFSHPKNFRIYSFFHEIQKMLKHRKQYKERLSCPKLYFIRFVFKLFN